METGGDIAGNAVVHARKLVGLRSGRWVEESHRRIDGGTEGTIVMGGKIRGVGKPGIHVA
jgi:hypothetical protein